MLNVIVIGFFAVLGAKAAIDVYDSAKSIIVTQGPDVAKKVKEEFEEHIVEPLTHGKKGAAKE